MADWLKEAIIYRLSEGQIPDFAKLAELNITALSLSGENYEFDPMDISEPKGNVMGFLRMVSEAHSKGIRVILDLDLHHTSAEHPWFTLSKQGEAPYKDFYVWRKLSKKGIFPNNWLSLKGEKPWSFSEERQLYYLHLLDENQPDLNLDSNALRVEIKKILQFWLEHGVDGFTFTNVSFISKEKGLKNSWLPLRGPRGLRRYLCGPNIHAYLAEFRRVLNKQGGVALGMAPYMTLKSAMEFIRQGSLMELDAVLTPQMGLDYAFHRKNDLHLPARKVIWSAWQRATEGKAQLLTCGSMPNCFTDIKYFRRYAYPLASYESLICSYLFRPGAPIVNQPPEVKADFLINALYLRRTLPVCVLGPYKDFSLKDKNVHVYGRLGRNQKLLIVSSFSKEQTYFTFPKELEVEKAELVLSNYGEHLAPQAGKHGDEYLLQPYECRIYKWEKQKPVTE